MKIQNVSMFCINECKLYVRCVFASDKCWVQYLSFLTCGPRLWSAALELPGSLTASLEEGVAIINLHSNHRSARSNLQQVLEHNLSPLIKSYQQKVINELVVYACISTHNNSNLSIPLLQHWLLTRWKEDALCLDVFTSKWQANHSES